MPDDQCAQAQFSRPAQRGPFGTLDVECKTHVDMVTLEAFDRLARRLDFGDRSKLLRHLIYKAAHGKSFDTLMAEAADRRANLLMEEGRDLGQEFQTLRVVGEVGALPREQRA